MPILGVNAERAAIVLGFGLTVLSLILTQFYAEPIQHQRSDVREKLAAARTSAKILSAANAMDNIFGQLGSLVFTLDSRQQPDENSADVVRTLQRRAMDWRHDGVRTYLAQLGVAGEVDYLSASKTYEALVADELRLGTIVAYQKANDFEADLSLRAVKDTGVAAMSAISLHSKFLALEADVQSRKLVLMLVTLVGSTFILVATLIAMSEKPAPAVPAGIDGADLTSTILAFEAALSDIRSRIIRAGEPPGARET
jgi:hypothetical protein